MWHCICEEYTVQPPAIAISHSPANILFAAMQIEARELEQADYTQNKYINKSV